MSIYIEAEPERPQLFDDSEEAPPIDPAVAPFADNLRAAYVLRVQAYHRALSSEFDSQLADSPNPPASAYPRLMLPGDDPQDGEEEIVCDADLFATIFDLYAVGGWAPIARLQSALEAQAKNEPHNPSGGTPGGLRWYVAYTFFLYCRNMLALLIRESLMDLERRAAVQMIARLSVASAAVTKAVTTEFQITRTVTTLRGLFPVDETEVVFYKFGNTELVKTASAAVKAAVEQRVAWETLVETIGSGMFQGSLARANAELDYAQWRGITPREIDVNESKQMAAALANATTLRDASQGYYDAMQKIIGLNCPLALLTIDGLRPGFEQAGFERALGTALWDLHQGIDDLGKGIEPQVSMVGRLLAGLPDNDTGRIDLDAVQRLAVPAGGPELAVITAAAGESAPAYLPVLHEMTWWLLVQQGEITVDSFEYVVMNHYLAQLGTTLDEMARARKQASEFFAALAKVSAALSIALLVTPLGPVLRTVSVLADLAVMAYQISSVIGQMSRLDKAIADTLVEPGAFATGSLGRLGELVLIRREFAEHLPEQLVMELFGAIAGGSWRPVRNLMIARGFVADVETILDTDEADE